MIPAKTRKQVARQPWSGSSGIRYPGSHNAQCCPIGFALFDVLGPDTSIFLANPGSGQFMLTVKNNADAFRHADLIESVEDRDRIQASAARFMQQFDSGTLDRQDIARAFGVTLEDVDSEV